MLFIIGGVSRSGKSTIARLLSEKYNVPYFPMDILMSSLIEIDNPLLINYKADSDIIASQMWSFTKSVLTNLFSYNSHFILEGIAFWPGLMTELNFIHNIQICFLGMIDIKTGAKITQLRSDINSPNSWQTEFKDEELVMHINRIKNISMKLKNECELYNFEYMESGNNLDELLIKADTFFNINKNLYKQG